MKNLARRLNRSDATTAIAYFLLMLVLVVLPSMGLPFLIAKSDFGLSTLRAAEVGGGLTAVCVISSLVELRSRGQDAHRDGSA